MNPAEQPYKTYRKEDWYIYVYSDGLMCQNSEGKTFIIRDSTEVLRALPHYLVEYLHKRKLLVYWELAKLTDIAKNIQALRETHERFVETHYANAMVSAQPT